MSVRHITLHADRKAAKAGTGGVVLQLILQKRYKAMKKLSFVLLLLLVIMSYFTPIIAQSDSFFGYGNDGTDYYDDMRDRRPASTLSPQTVEYVNRETAKVIVPIIFIAIAIGVFKIIESIIWSIKNHKPGRHW